MKETLIFGPPGCGKTYTLINIVKKELKNGTPIDRIGFVSFSRKSIAEARDRIFDQLKIASKDAVWFKTLHSTGYHWLGFDESNMLTRSDFWKLSEELGLDFDNNTATSSADGLISQSNKRGNRYLELIGRSVMREISLEEEYNNHADYELNFSMLKKVDSFYKYYKKKYNKYDFTDMIRMFVEQGTAPKLDALIVDEAQDLTPLQWSMVNVLKQSAQRVWYAGDDDQAIHSWNGVEVEKFLKCCDNVQVLNQSFRIPKTIFGLAGKLSQRILKRKSKTWNPTDNLGTLNYHLDTGSFDDINLDQNSWTIMTRTNKILSRIERSLRNDGFLYERYGRSSFNIEYIEHMDTWNDLKKGDDVALDRILKLYDFVPKLGANKVVKRGSKKTFESIDPQSFLGYNSLVSNHGMLASKEKDAEDIVNMSEEERFYKSALLRRGEDLTNPRIKLSTIHQMKGGEDDNIILFNESCYPAVNSKNQDEEHRVFYTGVTRAKQNLHIVESSGKYRYII